MAPQANVEVAVRRQRRGRDRGTSYPRVQVHAGRNARLRIVERHLSAGSARLRRQRRVRSRAARRRHASIIAACRTAPTPRACFDTLVAHVGERGDLSPAHRHARRPRLALHRLVKLAGRAARCELTAASIANGIQTHDVFAEIEHAGADTVTRELYRGIATDRGKLGFNGKMIVRETAHGADSDQSLKTLLTGSGAEAAVRPQLEIYTDRVRAKHGATTGKLDEQMLFYLLSRGIDRRTAQTLLQWAFIEDAVSRIGLRRAARAKSNSWSPRSSTRCPRSKACWESHERESRTSAGAYDAQRVWRDFPILAREVHGKPLVFLDSAASSQRPRERHRRGRRLRDDCTTPTCIAACTS